MTRIFADNLPVVAAGAAIVAAACVTAPTVRADTVYKSVGPDGEVTYASQPVPGARESTATDIPSLSPEQRRAALRLRKSEIRVEQAKQRLDRAYAARNALR